MGLPVRGDQILGAAHTKCALQNPDLRFLVYKNMPEWLEPIQSTLSASALPRFEQPGWLLLILPLFFCTWWIGRRGLTGGVRSQPWLHFLLRCLLFAVLCIALAEPKLALRTRDVAVVAVFDVSESIPANERALAAAFLQSSLQLKPPSDRFGVVSVARDALVQSLPSSQFTDVEFGYVGPQDASHIEAGVRLARGLIPVDTAGRILLITDANETTGSLAEVARTIEASGLPIDVAVIEYDHSSAVRIREVISPVWTRETDTVNVRVVMESGRYTRGSLSLLINGTLIDLDPAREQHSMQVDVVPGSQVFTVPLRLPPGPAQRIEAVFEPDDGKVIRPENLRAETVTFTSGQGRVLLVVENPTTIEPLLQGLTSDEFSLEVRNAASAPTTLSEWVGYDAVLLVDQLAAHFSRRQQEDLLRYTHDAGGGLILIGGPDSFGAGGWIGSPLEDAMPLLLDPPQKRQMPLGALALVIDSSGSMSAGVQGTGLTQQQIANEAAILGIEALSRLDQVAVIAFSGDSRVVVPLTVNDDSQATSKLIRSISPGGGTNLFPAIRLAAAELADSNAGTKHIIVLTDGATTGHDAAGVKLAADLLRRGVSISTVGIGDFSNDQLLSQLAHFGGGRFYSVTSAESKAVLPQIFIKEAKTVRRALIWEGQPFVPVRDAISQSMDGLGSALPPISGYVVTADRGGLASVLLRGPENDPILAQWQFGLGRVTAYTSDAAARWNSQWQAWPSFNAFWTQQLKWAMRPSGDRNARLVVEPKGDTARVSLELFNRGGGRNLMPAYVRGRVIHEETGERSDVQFHQSGPGRYVAEVPSSSVGLHLLSVGYDAVETSPDNNAPDARVQGFVRAAVIRRSDDEVRELSPNRALLLEIASRTNGRVHELDAAGAQLWNRDQLTMPVVTHPVWYFAVLLGVGLLWLDVAARRIHISPERLASKAHKLLSTESKLSTAALDALAASRTQASPQRQIHIDLKKSEPAAQGTSPSLEVLRPDDADRRPIKPPGNPQEQNLSESEIESRFARLKEAKRRSLSGDSEGSPPES